MRITPIAASVATSLLLLSGAANATVTLTGADLTQDQAWRIAQGEEVAISKKAMKQVTDSNRLVMAALCIQNVYRIDVRRPIAF